MTDASPDGEPADPLVFAVAQYWEDIIRRADKEQAARLRAIIAGTAEPDPVEARAALGDELHDLLPAGHPVRQATRTAIMYSAAAPGTRRPASSGRPSASRAGGRCCCSATAAEARSSARHSVSACFTTTTASTG